MNAKTRWVICCPRCATPAMMRCGAVSPMVRSTWWRPITALSRWPNASSSPAAISAAVRTPTYRGGKPPVAHVFPRRHDRADFSAAFRRAHQRHSREAIWPVAEKDDWRPAQMAMSSLSIRSAPPRSAMRCCMTTPTIHPGRALFARRDSPDLIAWPGHFDNGTFTGSAGQGRFYAAIPFSTAHLPVSGITSW